MNASILLVEDDLAEARRLESALAHLGHRSTLATDGDAALACLEAEPFDVVLLDLVLPGLDGMGVLGAMRERGIGVPVVVAVTPSGLEGARSALKAGARDFVVKPAGALRLEVAIANAVTHGRRTAHAPMIHAAAAGAPAAPLPAVQAPALQGLADAPAPRDLMNGAASNVIAFGTRPEPHPRDVRAAETAGSGLPQLDGRGHVRPLDALEADAIRFALSHYGGRMSEVARRLGIGRSTLYRKLADLGLGGAEQSASHVVAAE